MFGYRFSACIIVSIGIALASLVSVPARADIITNVTYNQAATAAYNGAPAADQTSSLVGDLFPTSPQLLETNTSAGVSYADAQGNTQVTTAYTGGTATYAFSSDATQAEVQIKTNFQTEAGTYFEEASQESFTFTTTAPALLATAMHVTATGPNGGQLRLFFSLVDVTNDQTLLQMEPAQQDDSVVIPATDASLEANTTYAFSEFVLVQGLLLITPPPESDYIGESGFDLQVVSVPEPEIPALAVLLAVVGSLCRMRSVASPPRGTHRSLRPFVSTHAEAT